MFVNISSRRDLPEKTPDEIVANIGVLVQELTLANDLKIMPSVDIAYNIRGSGNIAPNKVQCMAKIAPIVTTHFISYHPI